MNFSFFFIVKTLQKIGFSFKLVQVNAFESLVPTPKRAT